MLGRGELGVVSPPKLFSKNGFTEGFGLLVNKIFIRYRRYWARRQNATLYIVG